MTEATPTTVAPGWKTKAFAGTAAAAILGLVFATGHLDLGTGGQIGSLLLALMASLGYSVHRGIVKADGSVSRAHLKSSEFWLAAAAVVVSLMYASGAFAGNDVVMQVLGVVGGILAALGYGVGKRAGGSSGSGAA